MAVGLVLTRTRCRTFRRTTAETAAAEVKEGLEATSEEGGSRFMMSTIVTGAPSTFPLPSAAVAVVMEMEDDADAKRALGERRLEQQVTRQK